MKIKEIDKKIKQQIKEYKKALKNAPDSEKETFESVISSMEKLLNHDNEHEKQVVFDAMNRVQFLKSELFFVSMFNNLFLTNAISVKQFAEQVSMENQEEYVKRVINATKDLSERGIL